MSSVKQRSSKHRSGYGFLNKVIDNLPIELHLKGYQYCGPGTKLEKRLKRKDIPINPLDAGCQKHDIAYSFFKDDESRRYADKQLATVASHRLKAEDASLGEKMAALAVKGAMKAKSMLGMGMRRNKKFKHKKKVKEQKIRGGKVRKLSKKTGRKRIIPTPKTGGILPLLLPILGALGALGGGAAGIAKAVQDSKAHQQHLAEEKRHNLVMEQAAKGKGLYLKPYKGFGKISSGKGLYLKPYSKNSH